MHDTHTAIIAAPKSVTASTNGWADPGTLIIKTNSIAIKVDPCPECKEISGLNVFRSVDPKTPPAKMKPIGQIIPAGGFRSYQTMMTILSILL